MIQLGHNITSPGDPLVKIPVASIHKALRQPKPETQAQIRQLRMVRTLDPKRYSELKRQLPYMVCGIFAPPARRSENFAYIEYFIIDIDHIGDKQLSLPELKQRLTADSRVVMCFVSPSEDGLKVMFRLSERCYDRGLFSLFYKAFAAQLAQQYNIEQVIDAKTCDVTRACFVSFDPDAYYNPSADTVPLANYVDTHDTTALFDLKHSLEHPETPAQQPSGTDSGATAAENPQPEGPYEPDGEIMRNILSILNPRAAKKVEKQVVVPPQLNEIIDELTNYIQSTGVEVIEVINISYGKKIRMKMHLKQAEVNLFYGKRGFSVVKSPRTGTDNSFNELMTQLVQSFLDEKL